MRFTAERYTPEAAESLGQRIVGLFHRYAYKLAADMIRPGQRVLDVGFGDGYGATILRQAGSEYVGVEVDPAAVQQAERKYEGDFRLYDGVHLPQETFDLAVCFQVLEHLEEPSLLLEQIRGLGCRSVFTTPNRELRLKPGQRPWNRYHFQEFSRIDLSSLLGRYFDEVTVSYVRTSGELEEAELARISRARRLARLDPLGLRYSLPEGLNARVRALLRKQLPEPPTDREGIEFSLSDDPGLDLFAVAQLRP